MRLLLDTHIALWALTDNARLSAHAIELLDDLDNEIYVSAASIWEIGIKHGSGRSQMPFSGADAIGYFQQAGYRLLDIKPEHAAAAGALPPLHSDPFDRMLIAQAQIEPMQLITHDRIVSRYDGHIVLV